MAIVFMCPRCDRKYSVSDAMAGRRATCKECGQEQTVPAARPSLPAASTPLTDFDEIGGADVDDDRGNPYAQDFDDAPPPPRGKPSSYDDDLPAPSARRKKKKGSAGMGISPVVKTVVILVAVVVMVGFGIAAVTQAMQGGGGVQPGTTGHMLTISVMILCVIVALGCWLANLSIIFSEDGVIALLASFFIPVVGLVFIARNWDKTAKYFGGYLLSIFIGVFCLIALEGPNGPNRFVNGPNGFANGPNAPNGFANGGSDTAKARQAVEINRELGDITDDMIRMLGQMRDAESAARAKQEWKVTISPRYTDARARLKALEPLTAAEIAYVKSVIGPIMRLKIPAMKEALSQVRGHPEIEANMVRIMENFDRDLSFWADAPAGAAPNGPEDSVVVLVTGLDEEAKWKVFGEKLGDAGRQQLPGPFSMMMIGQENEMSFRIGPKRDA